MISKHILKTSTTPETGVASQMRKLKPREKFAYLRLDSRSLTYLNPGLFPGWT